MFPINLEKITVLMNRLRVREASRSEASRREDAKNAKKRNRVLELVG